MLMPKRVKYRRVQRGRMKGKALRGNVVNYGEFGLAAQEPGWITSNQIEAARIAMTRYTKRGCPKRPPARLSALPATNCPSRRRSSRRAPSPRTRMQHATNHLDNPTKISATRRDIARVKTVLREKQN